MNENSEEESKISCSFLTIRNTSLNSIKPIKGLKDKNSLKEKLE